MGQYRRPDHQDPARCRPGARRQRRGETSEPGRRRRAARATQPVSLLYYGYDELADLANVEDTASALKQQFYSTVWDTVDPLGLLHVEGESGI